MTLYIFAYLWTGWLLCFLAAGNEDLHTALQEAEDKGLSKFRASMLLMAVVMVSWLPVLLYSLIKPSNKSD